MNLSGFSSRLPGGRKGLRVIGVTIKLGIWELIKYFKNDNNRFRKDKNIYISDEPEHSGGRDKI